MPWTFAHPAAVLPLRRLCPRYLSFPALIVGSIAPDIGYYVAGSDFATQAHSFEGIPWIGLPSGLLVLGLLCLLRKPLCFVLPQPHRAALSPLLLAPVVFNVLTALKVTASLMLGATTHIVWDAFTHQRDLIGLHIKLLQVPVFHLGATAVQVYYLMQWLSTLAGSAILVIAYRHWLRSACVGELKRAATHEDRWRWRLLTATAIAAVAIAVPLALDVAMQFSGAFAVAVLARCIAVFGAVAFAALLAASAMYSYARSYRHLQHPRPF